MKILLAAIAALVLTGSAQAQNTAAGDAGVTEVAAPPAAVAKPAVKPAAEAKAKTAEPRPAATIAPAAQNAVVASGPDDLGEQPINATPFDPAADRQDTASGDASDADSYRGPRVAFPLIVAGLAFLALSGLALYFLPTIIALVRRKRNGWAIFALNFFLGWSFIGWVVALIWAVMADSP